MAGISSHHLLASAHIDRWFEALARARDVGTFLVVSPAHFGQSLGTVVSCPADWDCGAAGVVRADRDMTTRIRSRSGVREERAPFIREHGVSTLMPFLKRHFPGAKVAALLVPGELPARGETLEALSAAVLPELSGPGEERVFLLVSSDFSHHADSLKTAGRDAITRGFLERPGTDNWFRAGCDNRPGMHLLGVLASREGLSGRILWHTDALTLFPGEVDPGDVTSYFFWFLVSVPGT